MLAAMATLKEKLKAKAEELATRSASTLERMPPFRVLLAKLKIAYFPGIFFIGLLCGDLILHLSSGYLTKLTGKPRTPAPREIADKPYLKNRQTFEQSISKNSFCPGCPVPDIRALVLARPKDCGRAKLMPNSSSLKVIGTIVLSIPEFSVATVSVGSAESKAIKKGDDVPNFGKVFEIRRDRICFEKTDGFLGYADIPQPKIVFGKPIAGAITPSAYEGIARTSDDDVEISKSFLMEKINDSNVIMDAHAVVYRDPVSNMVKGFKIVSVKPGSVFEAMDIRGEDIIESVNGEPMNSLVKAQELYNALANTSELSLGILRGGQPKTKKFRVK